MANRKEETGGRDCCGCGGSHGIINYKHISYVMELGMHNRMTIFGGVRD